MAFSDSGTEASSGWEGFQLEKMSPRAVRAQWSRPEISVVTRGCLAERCAGGIRPRCPGRRLLAGTPVVSLGALAALRPASCSPPPGCSRGHVAALAGAAALGPVTFSSQFPPAV